MPIGLLLGGAIAVCKKAVDVVSNAASRTLSNFLTRKMSRRDQKPSLPAKVKEVRVEPRVRQEELAYSRRRETREQELLAIQADRARLEELRFQADMQIEAAKAEREEKALKLKERELSLKRQELGDRRKMSALYLDVLREQTAQALEIKRQEIQAMFDQQHWPAVISRDEVERIFVDGQEKMRLLMLVPPPDISEDFPLSFRDGLKKEIRNNLKIFLETHYPLEDSLRPVEFYGKYFERSVFDAEVKQLETILAAVPTAVIYTDITDHEVYFNARFWGLEEPVSLSFEPWDWEAVQQELLAEGKTEKQSLRIIRQIIVALHQLYGAFLADWYYLNVDPNYQPQLFELAEAFPTEWTGAIVEKLRGIQQEFQQAYLREIRRLAEEEQLAEAERLAEAARLEEEKRLEEAARLEEENRSSIRLNHIRLDKDTVTVNEQGTIVETTPVFVEVFTEELGNGVTLTMVQIPAGTFMMGSPGNELNRNSDESPQHQVTVPSFFMGMGPVTQAVYEAVMGTNPSQFEGADRPVECVSWHDAIAFCQKLSEHTGNDYRLPSEAEWEYACRAGKTTPFYFGPTLTTHIANYDGDYTYGNGPKGQYRRETTPVASFPPNAFGLYDMHGNVREWCADHWRDNYQGAPSDGSAWLEDSLQNNNRRVWRGGSWDSDPRYCRSAYRYCDHPDLRDDAFGFRVVVSAPGLPCP